jgi:glutaredoxin
MIVEVYTKPDCSYCQLAKVLLADKNISFTEMVLNRDFSREYILEKFPSAKAFPVVVVDGYFIGGYSQLKEHIENTSTSAILLNE